MEKERIERKSENEWKKIVVVVQSIIMKLTFS